MTTLVLHPTRGVVARVLELHPPRGVVLRVQAASRRLESRGSPYNRNLSLGNSQTGGRRCHWDAEVASVLKAVKFYRKGGKLKICGKWWKRT